MRAARLSTVLWGLLSSGCFLFNTTSDDGGPADATVEAGTVDAAMTFDGAVGDGSTTMDAGECAWLGETRLCSPFCAEPCPPMQGCSTARAFCFPGDSDPRGDETQCAVDLEFGNPYCYRGARLCAVDERSRPDEASWVGACVSQEYCRWVLGESSLDHIRCRYSEGTAFVNGPPDEPCGVGAAERSPFCGGRCGDTCPESFLAETPACVGISETRGFGVCTLAAYHRCSPNAIDGGASQLDYCERAAGGPDCVCMVLSPVELPDYSDRGWGVARQSCVAYRSRFPDNVRCYDRGGREI